MIERTEERWRASPLGYAATHANLELKRVVSLARQEGLETEPGSFIGNCWEAAIAGYQNAREAWMAGDDGEAGRFIVYAAMLAGMAGRDSTMFQRSIARGPRKPWQVEDAKKWRAAGQDWPDIVRRLQIEYEVTPQRAREICRDAGRPKRKTTKASR